MDIGLSIRSIFSRGIERNYKMVQDLLIKLRQMTATIIGVHNSLMENSAESQSGKDADMSAYYAQLKSVSYRDLQRCEDMLSELHSLKEFLVVLKSVDLSEDDRGIRKQIDLCCDHFDLLSKRIAKDFSSKLGKLARLTKSMDHQLLSSWAANLELDFQTDNQSVFFAIYNLLKPIQKDIRTLCVLNESNAESKERSLNLARDQLRTQHQRTLDCAQTWCNRGAMAQNAGNNEQVLQADRRSKSYKVLASNLQQCMSLFDEVDHDSVME